jgi:hypothetical protein
VKQRRLSRFVVAFSAVSIAASAQAPILHEYIEPNPTEDLELAATTQDGAMPAALETESGVVPAPREQPQAERAEHAYGGNATPDSIDASFRIDRDTTRPDTVSYDEPFVPALAPFKRLYAYDAVDQHFELSVRDRSLSRLYIGGKASAEDDQFYADMFVDLTPGVPVRIPSVGAGARVLVARTEPEVGFQLQRDRAENWFMVGDARRRVRFVMQLAIERAVFGSPFGDASWSALSRELVTLPEPVRAVASEVARELGVSQQQTPSEVTRRLVEHFRSFAPSQATPQAERGAALYRELSLSKKGVCRHRAYAFLITALGVGLPARMVRNEAHAWVEVWDSRLWHRIDLGGAAGRLDLNEEAGRHVYRAPPDPYAWPAGSESGQALLQSSLEAPPGAGATAAPTPGASAAPQSSSSTTPEETSLSRDERPEADVVLKVERERAARGASLEVSGTVLADGKPCSHSRVDVSLRDSAGIEVWLGAFPTGDSGRLEGRVTVPFDVDVGEYTVVARTPGAGRCGASR